ncbi:hypothetical protein [Fodinicola feengrottensis]|uniref:hypothetical protein n=1 Tax=Fodinicola feengrottensis TaxID=435914 RepID=UPI0024420419|nr:hypothetical protein [Fodinicola feengrottensis]
MALSVVEDSRVRLDGVVRDLAAVPDWAACWQPLDQPYGVEYANRIAAVTSWDPVAVVQLVSGQDLRSVEFTSPSGRHLLAAPAAVRPVPTWIWSVELDKEAATDDLVTSGRVQARAALDEAVQQLSERLGQPTGEPVWVDPDGAPAGLMMGGIPGSRVRGRLAAHPRRHPARRVGRRRLPDGAVDLGDPSARTTGPGGGPMTGWDGYAGWTGGVEIDTSATNTGCANTSRPCPSVRSVAPQPRPVEPPPARIAAAIGQLRARGVQVGSRRDLLAWLVDGWERVQQDRPGFVLAAPALAIRIFASGALPDTEDRPAVTGRQLAEAVADHLNNPVLRPPVATVTLPRLPDALIVDRLNLFAADGIEDELRRPLERLVAGRPELAESVADATGRPSVPALAGLIWRDGLALQYAREAAGEVVLI